MYKKDETTITDYQKLGPGKAQTDTFDISEKYAFRLGKQNYTLIIDSEYYNQKTDKIIKSHYEKHNFTYENKNTVLDDDFYDNYNNKFR
jgi:beta-lactamase superfamily II metal-dependent hydrolase